MSEWQPIETAPQEGTAIWLLLNGWPYIGYGKTASRPWDKGDQWVVKASFRRRPRDEDDLPDDIYGTYDYDVHPTHWMPLPQPMPDVSSPPIP